MWLVRFLGQVEQINRGLDNAHEGASVRDEAAPNRLTIDFKKLVDIRHGRGPRRPYYDRARTAFARMSTRITVISPSGRVRPRPRTIVSAPPGHHRFRAAV